MTSSQKQKFLTYLTDIVRSFDYYNFDGWEGFSDLSDDEFDTLLGDIYVFLQGVTVVEG